jgi:ribonuclease HII
MALRCTGRIESLVRKRGYRFVAGADEAGRGCLFGPVYAAAVILDPERPIRGLNDSKALEEEARVELASAIRQRALSWAVARAEAAEIDRINILQASRLAMLRAVQQLSPACDYLLVDAATLDWNGPQEALIKGDARVTCIAAASILAKVDRDRCLAEYEEVYPGYGLARHKGYPTPEHREALRRLGPTPEHRRSYAPVREAMQFSL